MLRYRLRSLLIITVVFAVGCPLTTNPPIVEFVVPAGFHGPFVVVQGKRGQIDSTSKVTFFIPDSRILEIDNDVLHAPHRSMARYEDGTPLPIDYEATADQVALRMGAEGAQMGVRTHAKYFVGTESDFARGDYSELLKAIPSDSRRKR